MCIPSIHLVVGVFNKANANAVKACLISISVYNMCINQHMGQVDNKKLEVLQKIADEVNLQENAKIEDIENDALVVVSDIEGRANDFLVKLKHAGVIDGVDVDKTTGKLNIHLNENFCGTIDFCGDLTAYKVFQPFRNEIVTEVFEELLEQIKKHNENKVKDKQIQFVAVPGNHEFYDFWGKDDFQAIRSRDDGGKNPLLIKLKSLKVIAEIQKYFLEQVRKNNDDITDNDYQGTDININNRIESLDKECKMLDIIYNALSGEGAVFYHYFFNYKQSKEELQKEKDSFKNGKFMIKTKKGKITNDKFTNDDNKFFWKVITKKDLEKIFTDEVCYLSFQEILEILKSNNNKYQENSGECTEWTEDLINEKLNDLKNVLEDKDVALNESMKWQLYRDNLEKKLTSIKDLETNLKSFETAIQKLKQELLQNGYIKQGEIEDENPISVFRPLLWDKSALLSKIVFNHRGKKFRTLHHFGLLVSKNYSANDLNKDNQNKIFANAFLMNQFDDRALDNINLRHLKRNIFENNNIPTLFGHEGEWDTDAQTSKMYCVDTGHKDNLNVVCVVDSENNIKPYYTYKCIKLKNDQQREEQDSQNAVELKLGDYDGEKIIKLAIYDCKHQGNISIIDKYVESGQQSFETVNAIDAIIRSKDTQKIEDYHRIFAFSQKDKRAQQVYETYKKFTDQGTQIIINDNQNKQSPKMVELKDIHSINTPCGGCF